MYKIQNNYLWKVTSVYKRTPWAALERETQIPLINLYMKIIKEQRALKVKNHLVEAKIT
jgi:hypothetical protein